MSTYRQLTAMAVLVGRQWARQSPRLRAGVQPEPRRGGSALLLRLLMFAFWGGLGVQWGYLLREQMRGLDVAAWVAFGVCCFTLALGFVTELPAPRMPPSALKSPLLEILPLSYGARLFMILAQTSGAAAFAVAFTSVVRRESGFYASLTAASLGLALFTCFALWGATLGKTLRTLLPTYWAARAAWLGSIFTLTGVFAATQSMLWVKLGFRAPLGQDLAAAMFGSHVGREIAALCVLTIAAVFAWVLLDRQSVDQLDPVKSGAVRSQLKAGPIAVERLLRSREPGGRFFVPFAMLLTAGICVGLVKLGSIAKQLPDRMFFNLALMLPLQLVVTAGLQRATRAASRDALARPLLGALPIAPRDTLAAKVAVVRRDLFLVMSPVVILLGHGFHDPAALPALAWRLATLGVTTWIFSEGAVAVAFLTLGIGTTRQRASAYGSLDAILLVIPCIGAVFAETPYAAVLSLLALGALTFEAKRAAGNVVDWLDDPTGEHGTELWRALLVFAAFQAAQLLLGQLGGVFGRELSDVQRLMIPYLVAGTGLFVVTQNRQASQPVEPGARRAAWGLAAGALAGAVAWGYVSLVGRFTSLPPSPTAASTLDHVLLSIGLVFVAPMAEERFFRGWLLVEIRAALGDRPWLAIAIAAFAFAVVHPAPAFVPVFVLGVVTGALATYRRSLYACVVAHAVYNALALAH